MFFNFTIIRACCCRMPWTINSPLGSCTSTAPPKARVLHNHRCLLEAAGIEAHIFGRPPEVGKIRPSYSLSSLAGRYQVRRLKRCCLIQSSTTTWHKDATEEQVIHSSILPAAAPSWQVAAKLRTCKLLANVEENKTFLPKTKKGIFLPRSTTGLCTTGFSNNSASFALIFQQLAFFPTQKHQNFHP